MLYANLLEDESEPSRTISKKNTTTNNNECSEYFTGYSDKKYNGHTTMNHDQEEDFQALIKSSEGRRTVKMKMDFIKKNYNSQMEDEDSESVVQNTNNSR